MNGCYRQPGSFGQLVTIVEEEDPQRHSSNCKRLSYDSTCTEPFPVRHTSIRTLDVWDNRNSKVASRHQDSSSWAPQEPDKQNVTGTSFVGFPQSHHGTRYIKETHNEGTAFVASPQSHHGTRYIKETHNKITAFVALLRSCAKNKDLSRGTRLHDDILKRGLLHQCSDALVTMYAKCGALSKAKALLDVHKSLDVITWNALIAGYARDGQGQDAVDCFECMQHQGIQPNAMTYASILKACGNIGAADKGEQIHDEIAKRGLLQNDIVLGNALVDMYAKWGDLSKAKHVLEELPSRDVISWNALIAGYAQHNEGEQALMCFERMKCEGFAPNAVTYACILKACGNVGAIEKGKQIHDEIARQGLLRNDVLLGSALVDMYAKCGDLSKAQCVLEKLRSRTVVSWNALITGYAQHGEGEQALNCFKCMQCEGIPPNARTYVGILKACGTKGDVDKGKQLHDEIVRQGLLQNNIVVGTALVDMYAKCGALSKAQRVLEELPSRDVVSWSALISGYAQQGQGEEALKCFERMQHEGISPNAVTYACILKACGTIGAIDKGHQFEDEIVRQGLLRNNIVLGSALVDMYAKCGALSEAQRVLEELPLRNVVAWSSLIAGYAHQGQGEQALDCFERMQRDGIPPNAVTYACILKACGTQGAVDMGKQIHDEIVRKGLLQNDIVLGSALVDMYAKCGALSKAQHVLDQLPSRNAISWRALIAGYAQQGQGKQALKCFEHMQSEGIPPDAVTCGCVLNVCSHLGLVEEGHAFFVNMSIKYAVKPDLECYTCMIDLFGRAGHLEKAVGLIQEMPSSNYSSIWHALLGACRKWEDVNVGRWAFERALQVDKSDGPAYILMADIYAAAGMPENAKKIQAMRNENRAWKKPGRSLWIHLSEKVHVFCAGDTSHAQRKYIYAKLEGMAHKISHSQALHSVLPNIADATKAHLLCRHSEMLALGCALVNTPQGETIRIVKNMRMCGDCHVATSLLSKIELRTIVFKDTDFCHHFEDGKCSCDGYL